MSEPSVISVTIIKDEEGQIWVFFESEFSEELPAGNAIRIGVRLEDLMTAIHQQGKEEARYIV